MKGQHVEEVDAVADLPDLSERPRPEERRHAVGFGRRHAHDGEREGRVHDEVRKPGEGEGGDRGGEAQRRRGTMSSGGREAEADRVVEHEGAEGDPGLKE